ncbi:MAG: PH domain-containing protein [Candidatus Woesearchaeota archaeon]
MNSNTNGIMGEQTIVLKPNVLRGAFSSIIVPIIIILVLIISVFFTTLLIGLNNKFQILITISIYVTLLLLIISKLIFDIIRLKNTTYTISKDVVTYTNNFFNIEKIIIPTYQITNIDSFESFILDKNFKTGTLNIYTSGSSSVDISFNYINSYQKQYEILNSFIQHHKKETRYHNDITSSKKIETDIQADVKSQDLQTKLLIIKPDIKSAILINFFQFLVGAIIFILTFGTFALISFISLLITSQRPLLVVGVGITIIGVSIGLMIGIYVLLKKRYSQITYYFFPNKVEYYDGFFNIIKHTIPYERITNSNSYQGIIERFFNVYTINIETAGSHNSVISIKYVKNGEDINKRILEILQEAGEN